MENGRSRDAHRVTVTSLTSESNEKHSIRVRYNLDTIECDLAQL
jgi:hypothetical protein